MTNLVDGTNSNKPEDEIDLIDLFVEIWRGKWIIILISILTFSLGLLYYFLSPTQFQAKVEIRKPLQEEITWLDEFSRLPDVNLTSDDIFATYIGYLTNENVVENFSAGFIENMILDGRMLDVNNISVETEIFIDEENQLRSIDLTFGGSNLSHQELETYIAEFLADVEQSTRDSIVNFVQSKRNFYAVRIADEIELLVESKQLAISQYQENLNAEIIILDENISELRSKTEAGLKIRMSNLAVQISIARKLGIERPDQNPEIPADNISILNTIESGGAPLFERGYVALEEELQSLESINNLEEYSAELKGLMIRKAVLDSRIEVEAFIPELISFNNKLLALNNNILGARYSKFLAQDNLSTFKPNFINVVTSFENPEFIQKTSPRLLFVALSIIAGFFLGLFFLIIYNVSRAVKAKLV